MKRETYEDKMCGLDLQDEETCLNCDRVQMMTPAANRLKIYFNTFKKGEFFR